MLHKKANKKPQFIVEIEPARRVPEIRERRLPGYAEKMERGMEKR